MKSSNNIKVVIAESSVIIRNGMSSVLKRLPDYSFTINEIPNFETLQMFVSLHTPDVIIINPLFPGMQQIGSLKKEYPNIKFIALLSSFIDLKSISEYDSSISIYDDAENIDSKFHNLYQAGDDENAETEQLSSREKEIIGFVVKGFTNKAIADQLSISIHTVITHRRNIAKKLQIHSSAGLAMYAIMNIFVKIQDIKDVK